MQASAHEGNLPRLRTQLSQWQSQNINISISQEDSLDFKPSASEREEVHKALNLPYPPGPHREPEDIDPIYFMLNQLMIQAARKNQVKVIRYLLEEWQWPVSRVAIWRAMATYSFAVLELFQEFGWDINEPVSANQCSILRYAMLCTFIFFFKNLHDTSALFANRSRRVVNNETCVRWCLTHGAGPNSKNVGKNIDVLTQAGAYAPVPVLELLAMYGGDFRCSNALHRAALGGLGFSTEEQRIEVLAWLLQDGRTGTDINQREYEFLWIDSWREHSMETALHCAARSNALGCVRFLLEKGIDSELRNSHGQTARDIAVDRGHLEAVKILDGL